MFCYGETECACSGTLICRVDVFQNIYNRIFKQTLGYNGTVPTVVIKSFDEQESSENNGLPSRFFNCFRKHSANSEFFLFFSFGSYSGKCRVDKTQVYCTMGPNKRFLVSSRHIEGARPKILTFGNSTQIDIFYIDLKVCVIKNNHVLYALNPID